MPEPLAPPGVTPLKKTYQEFAAAVRRRHPTLQQAAPDVWGDDGRITHAMVKAFPEFREYVIDPLEGSDTTSLPVLNAPPDAPGSIPPPTTSRVPAADQVTQTHMPAFARDTPQIPVGEGMSRVKTGTQILTSKDATGVERAGGAADVLEGGMEVATPLIAAGLVVAPIPTLVGLGVGTLATEGTRHVMGKTSAPPDVSRLVADLTGLLAGGRAIGKHGFIEAGRDIGRQRNIRAATREQGVPPPEMAALEEQAAKWDVTREYAMQEAAMRGDLAKETARLDKNQATERRIVEAVQYSQMLQELSKSLSATNAARAPFNYLDEVAVARKALPPAPEPPPAPLMLGAAPPGALPGDIIGRAAGEPVTGLNILPPGERAIPVASAVGHEPLVPGDTLSRIEGTQRIVAESGPPSDYLLTKLGDQLEESLARPPIPRITEPMRARIQDRQDFQALHKEMIGNMRNEMEGSEYIRGKLVGDAQTGESYYVPPQGWASVYREIIRPIVGDNVETGPGGKIISQILKLRVEGEYTKGNQIPDEVLLPLVEGEKYGITALRNAYNRWLPHIEKVARNRATRILLGRKVLEDQQLYDAAKLRGEPPGDVGVLNSEGVGRDRPPSVPGVPDTGLAGTPGSPPPATDDLPRFLDDLKADDSVLGGMEPDEVLAPNAPPPVDIPAGELAERIQWNRLGPDDVALPGMEGVRATETPTPPVADAPFALASDVGKGGPPETGRLPFGERVKDEEGHLILNVKPSDGPGLRRWLKKHESEYGGESWHEQALEALDEGDLPSAWRIAALASARATGAATLTGTAEEKAAAAGVIERNKATFRTQIETEIGHTLPDTVDVSPEGILTFDLGGKGVPAVKARATDLVMANALNSSLLDKADPTQIIRVVGNTEKALQITSQIADQVVREYPNKTIRDMAELMGFEKLSPAEQRIEVARQYRRAYSLAGKKLGEAGNWTQRNEDLFYRYEPVTETGAAGEIGSVGALQAHGVQTPEGFVKWLGSNDVPGSQFADAGFALPKGIELRNAKGALTPQAKVYARNWFRRQVRLDEIQKTIDTLAKDGNALEKALVRSNIAGESRATGGTLMQVLGLSKAFLIAKSSTAIRNLRNQGMRYGFTILDDLVAGTFATLTGNTDAARLHLTEARNMARIPTGAVNTVKLIKRPWADGLQAIFDYSNESIAGMPAKDVRRFLNLVEDLPQWEAKFLGSLSLEGHSAGAGGSKFKTINALTAPEVRNTMTVFNRMQEHFFRATIGDAVFRTQLELKGLNPDMALANPKELVRQLGDDVLDQMVGTAVSAALDGTFAGDPIPGTAPSLLLDIFSKHPIAAPLLQLGFPFPRFNFASAPRWLWDHFPLAPLTDLLAYGLSGAIDNKTNLGRGRYYFMKQQQRSGSDILKLTIERNKEEYTAAKALGEFMGAKEDARHAAAVFKALEKRAEKEADLPGLHEELGEVSTRLREIMQRAETEKNNWRAAEARIKNLQSQTQKATKISHEMQEAGVARSPHEYFAQKMTGAMLFAAAYVLRDSIGAQATKWYEYTLSDPGVPGEREPDKKIIDLRGDAPFVQPLFLADVAQDINNNTDWSEVTPEIAAGGPDAWSEYLRTHYTGKYTSQEFFKDALEAYLSISPAAGSTKNILDTITGRQAQGEPADLGTLQRALISTIGEFIGRFSSPLDAISDVASVVDEGSAVARIPAMGGKEEASSFRSLVDPTLANIPGLNRMIPEKISPLTGEPIKSETPVTRQTLGVTLRMQNFIESEIKRTGLPYGMAVPRQTGDREFDNQVNKEHAALLKEIMPQLMNNEQYQGLTPELKRDILTDIFRRLKAGSYAKVVATLDEAEQAEKMMSPTLQNKYARWRKHLETLQRELPAEGEEEEPEPEDITVPVDEPGAPPSFP